MANINTALLREAVLEAAWIQWHALGTRLHAERSAHTMVDPEALLLVSLALHHHEKRLWDVLASWAQHGSKLFSLQRIKNLQKSYPQSVKVRVTQFAYRARDEGNDFRWRSLVGSNAGAEARTQDLLLGYPLKWHPAALMVRMRLGFGIGLGSDLLSYLISQGGEWVSARQAAEATGYSVYALRRAADEIVAAQFIESTGGKPVQYRARMEEWGSLIEVEHPPPGWRFWHQVYAFAANLILADEGGDWDDLSNYLLSTQLRDLFEMHQDVFALNHLDLLHPEKLPGEDILPAMEVAVKNLAEWITKQV